MDRICPTGSFSASLCGLILAISLTGCGTSTPAPEGSDDPASQPEAQPTAYRENQDAQQYLRAVLSRYQNTASYQDSGIVQLSYQDGGKPQTRSAPIKVWLDHDQLYVAAYDVRIWRDDQSLNCWILDPSTQNFDSQVVRLPISGTRPTLKRIFEDPILTERITAGLAGVPPQLEWLFSPKPMEPLFDGTHKFAFGTPKSIDGSTCRSVVVDAQYRFWIDQRNSTIRRVDLPPVHAPANPGEPPQQMSLSVELVGASFRADRATLKTSLAPDQPKFVSRFVPLPPPPPPAVLGQTVSPFRVIVRAAGWTLTESGSDRELTLIIGYPGNAASHATVMDLERWQSTMPTNLRQKMRIVVLTEPSRAQQLSQGLSIPLVNDAGQQIAKRFGIDAGGIAIVDQRGVVSWIQPAWSGVRSEPLITLGAVLADLIGGVDVVQRMKQQWQAQVDQYATAVAQPQQPSTSASPTADPASMR